MKDFNMLEEAELIALTPEQIVYYIDLECAEAGIELLPPYKPPLPIKPPENDLNVYKVAGVLLVNMEEAIGLRDYLAGLTSIGADAYHYSQGYRHYFQPKTEPIAIDVVTMMSEQRAIAMKTEIAAHAQAQKDAEEGRAAYDKIFEQRDRVSDRVYAAIRTANFTENRRRELRRDFERYVELANGDAVMAARFLDKAKPSARELLPELFTTVGDQLQRGIEEAAAAVKAPADDIEF